MSRLEKHFPTAFGYQQLYGFLPGFRHQCNNVRKEGRKRTGLAWEDSGEIYSDKLKQLRTLRALKTSTLLVVSAITVSIRFGCLPLTDRAPESSLRLSPRVPTPRWLYWVSPRQLLQSDTGVPHFALDPLTYRCLLSLSPAADFAEPRPPRHIDINSYSVKHKVVIVRCKAAVAKYTATVYIQKWHLEF